MALVGAFPAPLGRLDDKALRFAPGDRLRAHHAQLVGDVLASAAQLLSSLSQFVGVVTAPRKPGVFHHIEFLRLSERRVLVILVAPDGDVQNRILSVQRDYTEAELIERGLIQRSADSQDGRGVSLDDLYPGVMGIGVGIGQCGVGKLNCPHLRFG